jgi:hypothetical protein
MPYQQPELSKEIFEVLYQEMVKAEATVYGGEMINILVRNFPSEVAKAVYDKMVNARPLYGIERARAEQIARMAEFLNSEQIRKAHNEVLEFDNRLAKIIGLCGIAPFLEADEKQQIAHLVEEEIRYLSVHENWARLYSQGYYLGMMATGKMDENTKGLIEAAVEQLPKIFTGKSRLINKLASAANPQIMNTIISHAEVIDEDLCRTVTKRLLTYGEEFAVSWYGTLKDSYNRAITASLIAMNAAEETSKRVWLDSASRQAEIIGDTPYFELNYLMMRVVAGQDVVSTLLEREGSIRTDTFNLLYLAQMTWTGVKVETHERVLARVSAETHTRAGLMSRLSVLPTVKQLRKTASIHAEKGFDQLLSEFPKGSTFGPEWSDHDPLKQHGSQEQIGPERPDRITALFQLAFAYRCQYGPEAKWSNWATSLEKIGYALNGVSLACIGCHEQRISMEDFYALGRMIASSASRNLSSEFRDDEVAQGARAFFDAAKASDRKQTLIELFFFQGYLARESDTTFRGEFMKALEKAARWWP